MSEDQLIDAYERAVAAYQKARPYCEAQAFTELVVAELMLMRRFRFVFPRLQLFRERHCP